MVFLFWFSLARAALGKTLSHLYPRKDTIRIDDLSTSDGARALGAPCDSMRLRHHGTASMPRRPPPQPRRYPAIWRVEVRKVVRHDEDIVEACIVVRQHRAISICKDALKLANPFVIFRAVSLASPATLVERNFFVKSLLLRCLA
jgi:hypothetical protein